MKHQKLSTFEAALKKSALPQARFYLFNVKDEIEGKGLVDQVCAHWALPCKRLVGDQTSDMMLKDELFSQSLFDQQRVVVIERVEKMKKSLLALLEDDKPSSSITLILCATYLKNEQLYRRIEKEGVLLDLTYEKPWERQERYVNWICQMAQNISKTLSKEVAKQLLQQSGYQPALLKNELDKLACFIGERSEITSRDLATMSVQSAQEPIWHWALAILQKNIPQAFRLGRSQIDNGHSIQGMLVQLRLQFQSSYRMACLAKKKSFSDLQHEFPQIRGEKALLQAIDNAEAYGSQNLRRALVTISDMDLMSRSTVSDPHLIMELLVTKLIDNNHQK